MSEEEYTATFCHECERLLGEYLSAAREARVSLEAAVDAQEAELLDELGSLSADMQVENALSHLSETQQAYNRHRRERRHSPGGLT